MLKVFVQKRSIELIISEKLYGEFELEKVLEDLILSKPVQRSKGSKLFSTAKLVELWDFRKK